MKRNNGQRGQTVVLLLVAMSLVIIGAMGFAIDGARLYLNLQEAQVAADSAATATAMGIFQGTDIGVSFTPTDKCTIGGKSVACYICSTKDTAIPCVYARTNGFGSTSGDTVMVDFPTCTGTPDPCGYQSTLGTDLPSGTPTQVRVTIQRKVGNSIIRMLGAAANTPVQTSATAAIVSVESPTPLLITDPYNPNSLHMNGTDTITICGGPKQSVQVNSKDSNAYYPPSSGYIDLTHAGPKDKGNCVDGTGASFGLAGYIGPNQTGTYNSVKLGNDGAYEHHSKVSDPYSFVCPVTTGTADTGCDAGGGPAIPSAAAPSPLTTITKSSLPKNYGCTAPNAQGQYCNVYFPGLYGTACSGCTKFDLSHVPNIILTPGVYYVEGGGVTFKNDNGGNLPLQDPTLPNSNTNPYTGTMCSEGAGGCADVNSTQTTTGDGVLIYNTGANGSHNSGPFFIDTLASVSFVGPTLTKTVTVNGTTEDIPIGPYYGLTLWNDRQSTNFVSHQLGQGNGCFSVTGTTYITPTLQIMEANNTQNPYQLAQYNGTPCGNTITKGDIVVSDLLMAGNSAIKMNLQPLAYLYTDQVALVAGGPHP